MTGRPLAALVLASSLAIVLGACVIDEPDIERSGSVDPTPTPANDAAPSPTEPATPVDTPSATPQATPTTAASATPTPAPPPTPTPLAAEVPTAESAPTPRQPGLITVPVNRVIGFRLASVRPVLQLPAHTLIYVDPDREAEVDIFTPVADGVGNQLTSYSAVIAELTTNPAFADLSELAPTSIAGFPTRVFAGRPVTGSRGFYADLTTVGNDSAGWYPPARLQIWVIDHPNATVALTAESLFDPGQFDEALTMASGLLSTITFG